ncbi:MAG: ABC transporter permease [Candidatus Omnitrophica bacterium]|nr:ABC transporter permease [Candidatus Omnitrophota bacterium]
MIKNTGWKRWKRHLNLFNVLSHMHMRTNDYRTFLGALWSFLGPVITFAVLYFIFVDRFGKEVSLFSLKLLVGVVAVNFFNAVVRILMGAVRQSREVAVDCIVPSEIFIAAPLVVPLTKFLVEITLCLVVAFFMGVLRLENIPWILLNTFFFCILACGFALILGVLNFLAADVSEIWSRIETLLLFVTPVFYSLNSISPLAQKMVLWLNPVTAFVLSFQTLVSADTVPGWDNGLVGRGIAYALVFLGFGYYLLKKFEKQILEIV